MVKSSNGPLIACNSSCLDVPPKQLQREADQPNRVLGAIENLPGARSPQDRKKQGHIQVDQGPAAVDATTLFAQARALLRQLPCTSDAAPSGREQQYQQLHEALQEFSSTGRGSSLYVSGLPGTGWFPV